MSVLIYAAALCILINKVPAFGYVRHDLTSNSASTTNYWLSQDMCNNYYIRADSWRSMRSDPSDQCDGSMAEGWYRFLTPDGRTAELPAVCVKTNTCGARVPLRVDLRGQGLPSQGQTMEIDICGSFGILGKWDCCVLRQTGYIHNCGTYFVYKLRPPDRCSVGYCILDVDNVEDLTVKTGETLLHDDLTSHGEQRRRQIFERDVDNENVPCPEDSFACDEGGKCYPESYRCDSYPDCKDKSDEINCTIFPPSCPEGQRGCPDGSCVSVSRSCNFFPGFFTRSPPTTKEINTNFTFNVVRPSTLSTLNGEPDPYAQTPSIISRNFKTTDTRTTDTRTTIPSSQSHMVMITTSSSSNFISTLDVSDITRSSDYSTLTEVDRKQTSLPLIYSSYVETSTSLSSVLPSLEFPSRSKTKGTFDESSSVNAESSNSHTTEYILSTSVTMADVTEKAKDRPNLQAESSVLFSDLTTRIVSSDWSRSHTSDQPSEPTAPSMQTPKYERPSHDHSQASRVTPSDVASHFVSSAIADVIGQIAKKGRSPRTQTLKSNQGLPVTALYPSHPASIELTSAQSFMSYSTSSQQSRSTSTDRLDLSSSVVPVSTDKLRSITTTTKMTTTHDSTSGFMTTLQTTNVAGNSDRSKYHKEAVTMTFSVNLLLSNRLDDFVDRLRAAVATVFNLFYRSQTQDLENIRRPRRATEFEPSDVNILDIFPSTDNATLDVVMSIKDGSNNNSDIFIPRDIALDFLNRQDVRSFINEQLSDFDVSIQNVSIPSRQDQNSMDQNTLSVQYATLDQNFTITTVPGQVIYYESSWFIENFALFMIAVVVSAIGIVCTALVLWQIMAWSKCKRLRRKSGNYYVKCEQALLREVYRSILPVENPLSDEYITKDEDQMTEKQHFTDSESYHNENDYSTIDLYEGDPKIPDPETSWVVPITDFLDDFVHLRTEDTKL